jgi:hypothetical protein
VLRLKDLGFDSRGEPFVPRSGRGRGGDAVLSALVPNRSRIFATEWWRSCDRNFPRKGRKGGRSSGLRYTGEDSMGVVRG